MSLEYIHHVDNSNELTELRTNLNQKISFVENAFFKFVHFLIKKLMD